MELLDHPLFAGADSEVLAPLLGPLRPRQHRRGEVLLTPDVDSGQLHLILAGGLRAYQLTSDGREVLLELIGVGGFDGLLSIAGRRGHFSAATKDSVVASLPTKTLERLMAAQPQVAINLVRLVAQRLESREEQLETLTLHDPTQRLARQLLALTETLSQGTRASNAVDLGLTHQMLADMLGLRRETVTLHLRELAELGAVRIERGHVYIHRQHLQRLIEGA